MFRYGEMHDKLKEIPARPWLGRMEPFKIFGHTYFAGTYQASTHLIDTGDGLILVDPGYANTVYMVIDGIYKLGFRPEEIKYIVNTHWHGDHTEATAGLAALTGAKTLLGRDDVEKAAKHFVPDILVDDGDTLTLGNVTMEFLHTPGHTKGTISFFYEDTDGQETYRLGMFGGAGLNTLVPEKFDYAECREDYFASLERLKQEKVDIFLGNHTWNNDTYGKGKKLREIGVNEFMDPTIWQTFLETYKTRLQELIRQEEE